MRVCFVDGITRMQHKADEDFLNVNKKYHKCYEEEAKTCGAVILKHFIAYMKAIEEHFLKDGDGEFGKMVGKIPPPRVDL